MSIAESQLTVWAKPQSGVGAKKTHESIRRALSVAEPLEGYKWKVYLQGSYKNSTNTRGSHDVDVVVELTSHNEVGENARSWFELRPFYSFVSDALIDTFGALVRARAKCIRVEGKSGRIDADVVVGVPCLERVGREHVPGIRLYTGVLGRRIVNFPALHFKNGAAKNQATGGLFRKSVRMFKNARNHVNRKSWIAPTVPSYHLECLLYNVPNRCFTDSLQDTFVASTDWLVTQFARDPSGARFRCQNAVHELFGDEPIHWQPGEAERCVESLAELWTKGLRG